MQAGQLREQITIQYRSVTRDAFGGEIITWLDYATEYADVRPLQLREQIAAKTAGSEITMQIFIRYRAGVMSDMRVLWKTLGYPILSVIDIDSRHVMLELICGGSSPAT
jgi:SPP1 family predicted phage head-tail adaptor